MDSYILILIIIYGGGGFVVIELEFRKWSPSTILTLASLNHVFLKPYETVHRTLVWCSCGNVSLVTSIFHREHSGVTQWDFKTLFEERLSKVGKMQSTV